MPRVLLFNPENDVRLAEVPGRTPRKLTENVRALGRDGALLPLWWADENDYILIREGNKETFEQLAMELYAEFGLKANLVFSNDAIAEYATGMPWGWSYDSAKTLSAIGAVCPDQQQIEKIRQLSHRRTASEIASRLAWHLPFKIPQPAIECRSMADVTSFLNKHNGGYIKAPWSSSGRGVFKLSNKPDCYATASVESIIKRQGSVMCESALNGKLDFAMLFYISNGIAGYKGLSVFDTNGGTAYAGNIVASEQALEHILINNGADKLQLRQTQEALQTVLSDIIGSNYTGWLGIDMMILSDGSIAPCIELNLRMTMGVVAKYLARRIPSKFLPGKYTVGRSNAATKDISLTGSDAHAVFGFKFGKNC